ncbi:GntR family transcriptional regulator [Terrarubrum flagellatum]|uniref:GntR family transcriptional regulator n=1 Tax=Terrirubrum flagellatum TaxID=2895980 RepID=UPI003144DC79
MSIHKRAAPADKSRGRKPAQSLRPGKAAPVASGADSLATVAYDRIEDLIVHCRVAPGASITTKEIQELVKLGRTPVHQAVRRLAAETLIAIRPRDGLQISPIDLQRDRRLLQLRRELDRFVAELATERLDANQRNRLLHLGAVIRERRPGMDVQEFNTYDRQLDAILIDAAAEPFLERTLRPLHTIFRRTGNVHLTHLGGAVGLARTIDCHLALLGAIVDRNKKAAQLASDELIDFAQSMFDSLEGNIDPKLLNAEQ